MTEKTRVLILCSGNSARSQMAEGLLRHDGGEYFAVESAGTEPSFVRPEAIEVMREIGIDISNHRSKSVEQFTTKSFDWIITVCDKAKQNCPVFLGKARRIHWSLQDPATVEGDYKTRLDAFRLIREELRERLRDLSQTAWRTLSKPEKPKRPGSKEEPGHNLVSAFTTTEVCCLDVPGDAPGVPSSVVPFASCVPA